MGTKAAHDEGKSKKIRSTDTEKSNECFDIVVDFSTASNIVKNHSSHNPWSLFQNFFTDNFIDFLMFQANVYYEKFVVLSSG